MTVCNYFLEGRCRYGDKCWNEHPRGGRNQPNRGGGGGGGGGSVNRVWVNPSQRSGGGVVQSSSFSRGGADWGRGGSGTGRGDQSSNFNLNSQNRYSLLNNTQSGFGRTGGGGGGGGGGDDDIGKQLEAIQKDMEVWQSSGQWIFSCYSVLKACISGFVELSPEELRIEYYTIRATGNVESYLNSIQQLANQWRSRVQELRTMNANTRSAMIAELNNPGAQTSSGGGIFSSSATSSGFGSSSTSSSGFGSSATSSGFGSSATSSGFGPSTASSGFGPSTASSGFGPSTASSGFGSSTATSGFGSSTTSSGFGSSTATSGFGSSTATSGFGSSTTSSGFGSSSGFRVGGFGSGAQNSAAGFSFSASSPGFGSSTPQPASSQFGSSAPTASTFSFADPAGATASKSSAAGFSFTSASGGGFGSSSTAPGTGGFGGFGGGSSLSVEDRKSGVDNLYTPQSELTADELREFTAERFTLGQIPLRPPPVELLNV